MFLFSKVQAAAVYVPNLSVDLIKIYKFDYYTLYLSNQINSNLSIYECKYLICKNNISQDQVSLIFFLIHDIAEKISHTKYKLFIQKYRVIHNQELVTLFLKKFKLENKEVTSIIDLDKLESTNDIFSTNFKPFITAIPVKYKIIGVKQAEISQQMIIEKVSNRFRNNFSNQINVEFKNSQSIILNTKIITDVHNRFIVKKGVEYSVEFLDYDTIWINLSCTNFSITVNSVNKLGLKEPINYNNHRLVNIKTGRPISRKVQNVSDIKDPEYVFDTFDSTEAFSQRCENLRFSKEKFWFEQTNLQDTMTLINDLEKSSIEERQRAGGRRQKEQSDGDSNPNRLKTPCRRWGFIPSWLQPEG
ncbi:MAG: hypothetical protein KME31_03440 [Tolypothrix carrinoi HA7290-LM1]|jgi:hypothetical protein|nr:hypothetical protein [Tolypothrix carrinoi HA7290-LM1]